MKLLDLPREVVDEILKQAILARGLKRGLRLRLVNKFFASAVPDALCTFYLLDVLRDDFLDGKGDRPLFVRYLVHRLSSRKLPAHIPYLHPIRCAANEIYIAKHGSGNSPSPSLEPYIRTLCTAAVNGRDNDFVNFSAIYLRYTKLTDTEYEMLLFAAAIITNSHPIIEKAMAKDYVLQRLDTPEWVYPENPVRIFQHYIWLAATYGTKDTVEYLLANGVSTKETMIERRARLFTGAAEAGRADLVRAIYTFRGDYDYDDEPWETEVGQKAIRDSMFTPDPEVFDFVMELYETHCGLARVAGLNLWLLLVKHSRYGNVGAVKRLLKFYFQGMGSSDSEYFENDLHSALCEACSEGHKKVVQYSLAHGADPSKYSSSAITAAAEGGHLELARELLDMGFPCPETLSYTKAYASSTRLLLDAGALPVASTASDCNSLLVTAVELENETLIKLLLEHGASLSGETANQCYEAAKKEGLESMLQLLEQHGVDMEKCEAAYRRRAQSEK